MCIWCTFAWWRREAAPSEGRRLSRPVCYTVLRFGWCEFAWRKHAAACMLRAVRAKSWIHWCSSNVAADCPAFTDDWSVYMNDFCWLSFEQALRLCQDVQGPWVLLSAARHSLTKIMQMMLSRFTNDPSKWTQILACCCLYRLSISSPHHSSEHSAVTRWG